MLEENPEGNEEDKGERKGGQKQKKGVEGRDVQEEGQKLERQNLSWYKFGFRLLLVSG